MSILSFLASTQFSKKKVAVLVLLLLGSGIAIGALLFNESEVDLDTLRAEERAKLIKDEGFVAAEAHEVEIRGRDGKIVDLGSKLLVKERVIAELEAKPATVKWLKPETVTKWKTRVTGPPPPKIVEIIKDCVPDDQLDQIGTMLDCPGNLEIGLSVQTERIEDANGPLMRVGASCEVQSSMGWSARRPEKGIEWAENVVFEREAPQIKAFLPKNAVGMGYSSDLQSVDYARYLTRRIALTAAAHRFRFSIPRSGTFSGPLGDDDYELTVGARFRW